MSKYKRMSPGQAIYMPGALLGMTNSTALLALSSSRFMLLAFPSHSRCVGKVGGPLKDWQCIRSFASFPSFRKCVVASVRFTILTRATDHSEASNASKATDAGRSYRCAGEG